MDTFTDTIPNLIADLEHVAGNWGDPRTSPVQWRVDAVGVIDRAIALLKTIEADEARTALAESKPPPG